MSNLFNSMVRGFGGQIGRNAANNATKGSINGMWKVCWGFVKWCMIITFLIGVLEGLFGK